MTALDAKPAGPLPPPWDRIFSLGTKLVVWCLIFGIIYLLRPFFLLVFLTFVFAYIQAHGVDGLQHRIANRPARVVLVASILLGSLVATGFFVVPQIEAQAVTIAKDYPNYLNEIDKGITHAREVWGWSIPKEIDAKRLIEVELIGLAREGADSRPTSVTDFLDKLKGIGTPLIGIGSAFLLSLLFSFLIVLDMPKLKRSVTSLANTKLRFIYVEVADSIHDFGVVLGRALEAQLFIALLNTTLTAIGLYSMGLENIVFLSMVVFFCSFIPVAGVFLSSTPICLVALQSHGLNMMLIAIGLILVIHFIEAYILNPRIFGHHLHMNPVMVLIVLTIAGKLFGVWGLVLGLPIVNYFFRHAIQVQKVAVEAARY